MDSPQEGGSSGRGEDIHSFGLPLKSLFKTAVFCEHFKLPVQAGGQETAKMEGDTPCSIFHLLVETVPTLGESFSLMLPFGWESWEG